MSCEHKVFVFCKSRLLGPGKVSATGHCLDCKKPGTIEIGPDSKDLHLNWRTAHQPFTVGDFLGLKEPGACEHKRFEFTEVEDIQGDGYTVIKTRCEDCGKLGAAGITWPSDIVHWEGEPWDGSCRHRRMRFVQVNGFSPTEVRATVACWRCDKRGEAFIWPSSQEEVLWEAS
jgi:hypothetical protein